MDQSILEKYKQQMMEMYLKSKPAVTKPTVAPNKEESQPAEEALNGQLIGIISTVRTLYPVENARVTIFTGSTDDMNIISSALSDISGRTSPFVLPAPKRELSLDQNNTQIPYAVYNMWVQADGYLDNIHLNIPVFSGVTSLQRSNLMLKETAGVDKGPQIFDESEKYDL